MSLNTDPDERTPTVAEAVEVYVAREHWQPILTQALLHGAILVGIALLMGLPALHALALVHVVASASGLFSGLLAMRLDEMGQGAAAVNIARRTVAALLISGTALLLVPFIR